MSKAYLLVICLLASSFAGCLGIDDLPEENSSSNLEEAFNDFIDSIDTRNWKTYCKYIAYTYDDTTNEIILSNNTVLDECAEEREEDSDNEYKFTISNYVEENLDYRAANNSGFVYAVNFTVEECEREDEFEPWDCEDQKDESLLWVEVSGQWLYWRSSVLEQSAPIATFFVQEGSNGIYYVDVIKVSRQEDLAGFSYFLKDTTGSTYVGGNGFGEIAMQMISGNEHGIDTSYSDSCDDNCDPQLEGRASNVSADDGSDFPVHFEDKDSDGMLSAGDQFMVYGTGNSANGPAEDNWKLDIQFDTSGDIIGSARLG
jgi:hypothetical protein